MFLSNELKSEILKAKPCYFPNSFPKIFSWNDLEKLLNLRPFVNSKRFKIINDNEYVWSEQAWMSDINSFPPSLLDKELKTNHCYFADASRVNTSINSICRELEDVFIGAAVDAHIYFTISEILDGGFKTHWDYSHNLIIQVEGTTRFLLWDHYAADDLSNRSIDSLTFDPVYDVLLQPGDSIFVPMKSYHKALSQTKRLSVSFPISFNENLPPQDRHWIQLGL